MLLTDRGPPTASVVTALSQELALAATTLNAVQVVFVWTQSALRAVEPTQIVPMVSCVEIRVVSRVRHSVFDTVIAPGIKPV